MRKVIKANQGRVISVAFIGRSAGINPNRARFILDVMVMEGEVIKEVAKKYNDKYIRYTYKLGVIK